VCISATLAVCISKTNSPQGRAKRNSMTSSDFIRNLVSGQTTVPASKIIISGLLQKDFDVNSGHSYESSAGSCWKEFQVKIFNKSYGWRKIPTEVHTAVGWDSYQHHPEVSPISDHLIEGDMLVLIDWHENEGTWNLCVAKFTATIFFV